MWQKNPPNAADTVLIYQGGSGRLPWTPEQFAPYVSYHDPRDGREKWLFDGFLFIEFRTGFMANPTFSGTEGKGKWLPADKNDWLKLLDKNFEILADGHQCHGVPALEQCCAETEKRLGAPLRQRQVILTLPEPVENFTNWGELDGHKLDFSVLADRVAACDWYISQALDKWRALAPKHLTLAGFYFVPESIHGFESANASARGPKNSRTRPAFFLDSLLAREKCRRLEGAGFRPRFAAAELFFSSQSAGIALADGVRFCARAWHGNGNGI